MSRPPKSFTSLPAELITDIALQLDLSSAKSLALVCRLFRAPPEKRIWQHVNLMVDPAPYPPTDHIPGGITLQESEDRYRVAVYKRIQLVLSRSSSEKLGLVKRMTVIPRGGATYMIMELLQGVAATVRELRVEGRHWDQYGEGFRPDDLDMLDLRLATRQLSFPSLTHITLGYDSVRFASFIPLLCERAPNLSHLDLNLCQDLSRPDGITTQFARSTKIRTLRLNYTWEDKPQDVQDVKTILSIIDFSPHLEALSIRHNSRSPAVDEFIRQSLRRHEGLRDLCWCDVTGRFEVSADASGAWANLRRLVLHAWTWREVFDKLPALPSLESLHIHHWTETTEGEIHDVFNILEEPPLAFADPVPSTPMPPSFARHLRHAPRLRHINVLGSTIDQHDLDTFTRLNEIEGSNWSTGYVRSIRHGGKELLHARMLLNHTWDADKAAIDGVEVPVMLRGRMWFNAAQDAVRKATFPGLPPAAWWDFTDYEGEVVPHGLIQRMMEVEGYDGVWAERGIEVGEAAWKVLTDWKDAPAVAAGS